MLKFSTFFKTILLSLQIIFLKSTLSPHYFLLYTKKVLLIPNIKQPILCTICKISKKIINSKNYMTKIIYGMKYNREMIKND